ncbi:hypothetical protein C823_002170 [Eubacterium plexicaudatum ASF492]|uniref:Transposase IS4-like domain-containing protein n=1 Tax=Eubacterium plexicaudatum ASF492 TaxID=1235802 RepID=N2BHD5_9FIRM|nr:hypothetical protein C823_002170 [Eubacterium plexicaudatum ASF492]
MNFQNDFNKVNSKIQEVFKNWDNKILPHLPQQMDEMAKRTGALHRKRGVCSCLDLLRMLFLYASSNFSFRILAAAACALGISVISDTAWRKRFSKAAPFLREILHSLLSAFLPTADISAFDGVKNVLLVDASVIRQNGKQQKQQRIHLCYSLNENRMKQVKVTDRHTAESLTHFSMKKGDLVMADAGYGTAQNFIYAQGQGADVILRITPKNFCLYNTQGEKISLTALLKEAEEKHMGWIDVFGFCRYKGKTVSVRVIAHRLPDGQVAKARKRKTRKASKNQHRIQAETLLGAGWITLVTSLGAEYCGEEILHLYRSRWQVELLFKRFKQNFSIHTIKAGSSAYAETETLLWLIISSSAPRSRPVRFAYWRLDKRNSASAVRVSHS